MLPVLVTQKPSEIKILLVEDEVKVAAFIRKGLEDQHHEIDQAFDGDMAKRMIMSTDFDMVILDLIIPKSNGLEVCKYIRDQKKNVPVLMLTALGTTDDKVIGLESGADDYLVKPFQFAELLARINALARRKERIQEEVIHRVADLELNSSTHQVVRNGTPIRLTTKEFNLLELFIKNKNRVLSRVQIAESLWDYTFDTGSNVIDVYVNYLRNKIDKPFEKKLIHTIVGAGYVLKSE